MKTIFKKTNFIILLFVLSGFCKTKAQSYIPLLDTSKQWNVTENYFQARKITFALTINRNDTFINNLPYKIISHEVFDSINNMWKFERIWGFIREDTSSKTVYGMKQSETEEILLYDFSLEVGDVIKSPIGHSLGDSFKVLSIDTVALLNNEKRRRWILEDGMAWIEGIGNLDVLIYPQYFTPHDPKYEVLCFFENDIKIYKRYPSHDICYIDWVTNVEEIEKNRNEIGIYPNPSNGNVSIEFNHQNIIESKVQIIDMMGKTVYMESSQTNSTQIDLSHLSKGIYFLRLIENSKGEILGTQRLILGL